MAAPFVHLRIHTEFSLVDGIVRVKDLVKTVAADTQPAVAITDQSNMFALVKGYNACLGAGVKPVLAADVYIEHEDDPENPLIAQNSDGYRHLTELVSAGFTKNQHHEKPQVKPEWFAEKNAGLIAMSGFQRGDIGEALLKDEEDLAEQRLNTWLEYFPGRFYLELQRTDRANDEALVQKTVASGARGGHQRCALYQANRL